MNKDKLPNEWNFFFHILNHCFTPKRGELHGLPDFLQNLGYVVAYNLHINYGKLIMEQILYVIRPVENENLQVKDVECFYLDFYNCLLMMY